MGSVHLKNVLKRLNVNVKLLITFLLETHSSEDTFNEWRDDFKGEVFSSYSTTSSCGAMIGYLGNKNLSVN